jgi:hypothetical protein
VRAGARSFLGSVGLPALLLCSLTPAAQALPPPQAPIGVATASPSPAPSGATLAYGSTLLFVLDDKIDSRSTRPGTTIRLHLKDALVVNGVALAPAGAPETLEIVNTHAAASGDNDGSVEIHLDPFVLPKPALSVPIRAYHEYLTKERSAGNIATRDTTDTIGDIFIPYHVLYHVFRPGQQFVLEPGTVMKTEIAVTIDASNPQAVVLTTPPPFESTYDMPHSDLTPQPLYTPAPERPHPLPHGHPTLPPTSPPTSAPVPTASAAPPVSTASAVPAGSPAPAASGASVAAPTAAPTAAATASP